jgi:hypothetical protein
MNVFPMVAPGSAITPPSSVGVTGSWAIGISMSLMVWGACPSDSSYSSASSEGASGG